MTAKKIEELFSKIGEIQEDIQEIKSVLKESQADKVECTHHGKFQCDQFTNDHKQAIGQIREAIGK